MQNKKPSVGVGGGGSMNNFLELHNTKHFRCGSHHGQLPKEIIKNFEKFTATKNTCIINLDNISTC